MNNVKNVEALARLVGFCTGLGGQYNPGHQNLQLANLQTLLSNAETVLRKVKVAKTAQERAINHREALNAQLRTLVTRILAELRSTDAQTVDNALTVIRKIRGMRANGQSKVVATSGQPGEQPITKRRARGSDFIHAADHFDKLLETLATEPMYQPVVYELSIGTLQAFLGELRQANLAVMTATLMLDSVRHERDTILYGINGGVYIATQVKNKVKAQFGFNSDAYKDVRSISFRKPNA